MGSRKNLCGRSRAAEGETEKKTEKAKVRDAKEECKKGKQGGRAKIVRIKKCGKKGQEER